MRASLIQIAVDPDESVNSRRLRVASLVREQRERHGADLVVLPELWPTGAFAYESFVGEAEPLEGPTYRVMAEAAAGAGVWLHAGSIVERTAPDSGSAAGSGPLYNTSLVFSPDGELVRAYRKIHRFGFDKGEAVLMSAGEELVTVRAAGLTFGLGTCYDLRFPELFRGLVDAGAQAFVVPAGWPPGAATTGRCWPDRASRTRRTSWPAAPPAPTRGWSRRGTASSSTWGEVLAEAGPAEEVLTVDLDPARVAKTRDQFPALKDRRLR